MKIFFYAMREYDEIPFAEEFAKEMGISFGWTAQYPICGGVRKGDGNLLWLDSPVPDKGHRGAGSRGGCDLDNAL